MLLLVKYYGYGAFGNTNDDKHGGGGEFDGELFQNMNRRVPSEPIFLLTHEFEKLSIH